MADEDSAKGGKGAWWNFRSNSARGDKLMKDNNSAPSTPVPTDATPRQPSKSNVFGVGGKPAGGLLALAGMDDDSGDEWSDEEPKAKAAPKPKGPPPTPAKPAPTPAAKSAHVNTSISGAPGFSFRDPTLDDFDDDVTAPAPAARPVASLQSVKPNAPSNQASAVLSTASSAGVRKGASTVTAASSSSSQPTPSKLATPAITSAAGFSFRDPSLDDFDDDLPAPVQRQAAAMVVVPTPAPAPAPASAPKVIQVSASVPAPTQPPRAPADDPYSVMSEEDIELARLLEEQGFLKAGASAVKGGMMGAGAVKAQAGVPSPIKPARVGAVDVDSSRVDSVTDSRRHSIVSLPEPQPLGQGHGAGMVPAQSAARVPLPASPAVQAAAVAPGHSSSSSSSTAGERRPSFRAVPLAIPAAAGSGAVGSGAAMGSRTPSAAALLPSPTSSPVRQLQVKPTSPVRPQSMGMPAPAAEAPAPAPAPASAVPAPSTAVTSSALPPAPPGMAYVPMLGPGGAFTMVLLPMGGTLQGAGAQGSHGPFAVHAEPAHAPAASAPAAPVRASPAAPHPSARAPSYSAMTTAILASIGGQQGEGGAGAGRPPKAPTAQPSSAHAGQVQAVFAPWKSEGGSSSAVTAAAGSGLGSSMVAQPAGSRIGDDALVQAVFGGSSALPAPSSAPGLDSAVHRILARRQSRLGGGSALGSTGGEPWGQSTTTSTGSSASMFALPAQSTIAPAATALSATYGVGSAAAPSPSPLPSVPAPPPSIARSASVSGGIASSLAASSITRRLAREDSVSGGLGASTAALPPSTPRLPLRSASPAPSPATAVSVGTGGFPAAHPRMHRTGSMTLSEGGGLGDPRPSLRADVSTGKRTGRYAALQAAREDLARKLAEKEGMGASSAAPSPSNSPPAAHAPASGPSFTLDASQQGELLALVAKGLGLQLPSPAPSAGDSAAPTVAPSAPQAVTSAPPPSNEPRGNAPPAVTVHSSSSGDSGGASLLPPRPPSSLLHHRPQPMLFPPPAASPASSVTVPPTVVESSAASSPSPSPSPVPPASTLLTRGMPMAVLDYTAEACYLASAGQGRVPAVLGHLDCSLLLPVLETLSLLPVPTGRAPHPDLTLVTTDGQGQAVVRPHARLTRHQSTYAKVSGRGDSLLLHTPPPGHTSVDGSVPLTCELPLFHLLALDIPLPARPQELDPRTQPPSSLLPAYPHAVHTRWQVSVPLVLLWQSGSQGGGAGDVFSRMATLLMSAGAVSPVPEGSTHLCVDIHLQLACSSPRLREVWKTGLPAFASTCSVPPGVQVTIPLPPLPRQAEGQAGARAVPQPVRVVPVTHAQEREGEDSSIVSESAVEAVPHEAMQSSSRSVLPGRPPAMPPSLPARDASQEVATIASSAAQAAQAAATASSAIANARRLLGQAPAATMPAPVHTSSHTAAAAAASPTPPPGLGPIARAMWEVEHGQGASQAKLLEPVELIMSSSGPHAGQGRLGGHMLVSSEGRGAAGTILPALPLPQLRLATVPSLPPSMLAPPATPAGMAERRHFPETSHRADIAQLSRSLAEADARVSAIATRVSQLGPPALSSSPPPGQPGMGVSLSTPALGRRPSVAPISLHVEAGPGIGGRRYRDGTGNSVAPSPVPVLGSSRLHQDMGATPARLRGLATSRVW